MKNTTHARLTFDTTSDENEASSADSSNIAGVKPALRVYGFLCFGLLVQITHEHVSTSHANLKEIDATFQE